MCRLFIPSELYFWTPKLKTVTQRREQLRAELGLRLCSRKGTCCPGSATRRHTWAQTRHQSALSWNIWGSCLRFHIIFTAELSSKVSVTLFWTWRLDRTPNTRCRRGRGQRRWRKKKKKLEEWVDEQCEWERLIEGETRNWSVVENKENKMPFLIALRICFSKMLHELQNHTHALTHTQTRAYILKCQFDAAMTDYDDDDDDDHEPRLCNVAVSVCFCFLGTSSWCGPQEPGSPSVRVVGTFRRPSETILSRCF